MYPFFGRANLQWVALTIQYLKDKQCIDHKKL